jgi:hypothetical protein
VPQLNVYLPDDLAEILQRYRDRLNLSQICAHALRQEVQRMETMEMEPGTRASETDGEALPARSGPPDVPRILERLRGQKQRQEAAYRAGAEDAARWMEEAATIEELRWLGRRTVEREPGWVADSASVEEATDRFYVHFARRFEREMAAGASKAGGAVSWDRWFRRRREDVKATGANPNEYWPAYVKGWHQTIVAAWNELEAQLP